MKNEILVKKLDRAHSQIEQLEKMIEEKTREAFFANDQLQRNVQSLNKLYSAMPSAMLVIDSSGLIEQCNKAACKLLGYDEEKLSGVKMGSICDSIEKVIKLQLDVGNKYQKEFEWKKLDGTTIPVLVSISVLDDADVFDCSYVVIASDLSERKQMELELRHSQKLESIGQLAAGVAHEINTPMQYIGDNIYFMQDAINDLIGLINLYKENTNFENLPNEKVAHITDTEEEIDLEYLIERAPKAAERTLHGVDRVTNIISAMKAFSHPSLEKTHADINSIIDTALTVSKSEYKYIAKVNKDFGNIPEVNCNIGDINQVILNLIVNASHAISDTEKEELGTIDIQTREENDEVIISISDSGTGIPAHAQSRIFEPFYTTKEVGRGTGQGLALAYVVIVEKHGGKIHFKTQEGQGTTFFIHLPIEQRG